MIFTSERLIMSGNTPKPPEPDSGSTPKPPPTQPVPPETAE